jgi:hypothetical protein
MMEAEIIPVCPNDFMLFRGVHKNLKKYLKYNASRYKQKGDEIESMKTPMQKLFSIYRYFRGCGVSFRI